MSTDEVQKKGKHCRSPHRNRLRAGRLICWGADNPNQRYPSRKVSSSKMECLRAQLSDFKEPDGSRLTNSRIREDDRGKKSKVSERDLRAVELFI